MTIFTNNTVQGDFEKRYTQLRQKEGRIYTDEEVGQLPEIAKTHPHYKEWQVRKKSCGRLIGYLQKKQSAISNEQSLRILEVGCGNGWLSHRLSSISGSKVLGSDINFSELQQAGRVFYNIPNLHFIYSNTESDVFEDKQFEVIIFAASIQYFASLAETMRKTFRLLKPGGEIHIIDSPFYSTAELGAAKQRSVLYYESIGFPEMANSYFHHSLDGLAVFNHSLLYDPTSLSNRFLPNKTIFYWIRIQPL
jgi:2-polyprenyl-3-methyl-5-hydroxy-6-metoxy-1,4-benzoquinol methylase